MAYTLTIEDLQKLSDMGVNVDGVPEGAEATPEEMQALGVTDPTAIVPEQPSIPVASPDDPSVKQAPAGPVAAMPDAMPTTAQPQAMADLLKMMTQQQQAPTDPFENLSKRQRMMLGFAAIQDAGQALLGNQGTAFDKLMGRFTDIQDMERKRQIQTAELQARQQVFASLGADPLGPNPTPEQIDAHIAKLTSILATSPSMAPYVTAELARLNPMRERMVQAQNQLVSTQMGIAAADALIESDKLNEIAGFTGTFNEWANKFGGAPQYATLMSYVNQLQGLNFLEAYQQLKGGGAITELEGKAAAASRSRLEAALKGTPEDLRLAVMDVKNLFEEARSKNPAYKKSGELSQDYKSWLQKKN